MKRTALIKALLLKKKQDSIFSNMIVFSWDKLTSLIRMLLPQGIAQQWSNNKLLTMKFLLSLCSWGKAII